MEISILIQGSLLLLLSYAFTSALKLLSHPVKFPKTIPVVGVRKQILSITRASLRQLTNGITTLLDGYHQASNLSLVGPYATPTTTDVLV